LSLTAGPQPAKSRKTINAREVASFIFIDIISPFCVLFYYYYKRLVQPFVYNILGLFNV
jgi:hypothetical protein